MIFFIIFVVIFVIFSFGAFYLHELKRGTEKDARPRLAIIQYFKKMRAFDFERGIKVKDLPKDVAKHPALLMLVQDGTLCMEKGRYFLNRKQS